MGREAEKGYRKEWSGVEWRGVWEAEKQGVWYSECQSSFLPLHSPADRVRSQSRVRICVDVGGVRVASLVSGQGGVRATVGCGVARRCRALGA